MRCKICGAESNQVFGGAILKKYSIKYYRCPRCEFLQTEDPYWLDEAYASAISDLDLGPVHRALSGARITEGVIALGFDPNARFVDWGGGYGVLTRLMRDRGYDFYWSDSHCSNIFAKQFVARDDSNYELMTCFEVFEHFVEPRQEIEKMLQMSRSILFTTELAPVELRNQRDWWYCSPTTGQHISFYRITTLQYLAKIFDLHLVSNGASIHLLSQKRVSEQLFRAVARGGLANWAIRKIGRLELRMSTLNAQDYAAVVGKDFEDTVDGLASAQSES